MEDKNWNVDRVILYPDVAVRLLNEMGIRFDGRDSKIPHANIMNMVSAYGRNPSQQGHNEIYQHYLSECRKAELSGLNQPIAIPTGWSRQPERYTNYPWYVEVERDGKWHLRHHGRMGIYRNISTHDSALDAMKAIPETGN